jgi:hypothetical protein
VAAAAGHQLAEREAEVPVEAPELRVAQRGRRPGRVETGPPAGLVDQQVAEAGDAGLVQQPGLERRPAALEGDAQLRRGQVQGVGPEAVLLGVELHPAQAAGVADPERSAVGEAEPEPDPGRFVAAAGVQERVDGGGAVEDQATGHPEAQPQDGTVGVDQEELAPAPGPAQASAHERVLERRSAESALDEPRVRCVHLGNQATVRPLGEAPVDLDLDQLRHGLIVARRGPDTLSPCRCAPRTPTASAS